MHIKDLWKLRHHDQHLSTETSPGDGFKLPVAVELVLETPVVRGQQMIDGVKSIKETPWYRRLRRRGLHFVPLGYQNGAILIAIGTAASLGAAYLAYRKVRTRTHKAS
jgi:hypothetical protein